MFTLNLGYKWHLATAVDPVRAVVYLPVANHAEKIRRARSPEAQHVLFDPQLYLSGLSGERSKKACARLATYPWFGVSGLPEYNSTDGRQSVWEAILREQMPGKWPGCPPSGEEAIPRAAAQAVNFQVTLGCTHIILPSPLVSEREDEADTLATWLDAGVTQAEELEVGQPLLATVAIDEATINEAAFEENGFLDTIVDQVTSRAGIDGVYIVISQTHAKHPFETTALVNRAYLHLCSAFSYAGLEIVFVNFCDIFGLLCVAVGATGFGTGESSKLRRLSLSAFIDGGGGGKYLPTLYSHKVVGEFLTETDLDLIVENRLLGRIRDITPHSRALFTELQQGGTAANLPNWAESHMNVSAGHRHFLHRISETTRGMLRLSIPERLERVRDWVESASANELLIQHRLQENELKGHFAPTESWLETLDEFVE